EESTEGGRMPRRELKPRQEVERLTEVPAVVQPAGDSREVVEPGRHVAGALLEDPAALVLRKLPPRVCLRDGDERGASGALAAKRLLLGYQRVVLASRDKRSLLVTPPKTTPDSR